jgi:hypothetical protein
LIRNPARCPEQKRLHDSEADEVVLRTIQTILTSFGIEEEDRAGLRADFQHLRRWRRSVEHAQSYTFKAMITVIVSASSALPGSASRSHWGCRHPMNFLRTRIAMIRGLICG